MCVAAGEADAPGAHREKEENIQSYRRRVSNQNNRVLDTNEGLSFDVRICVSVRVDVSGKEGASSVHFKDLDRKNRNAESDGKKQHKVLGLHEPKTLSIDWFLLKVKG